MTRQIIRINFVVAVWLTISSCALFLFAATAGDFGLLASARPPIGIALLGVFELALWFVWYRHGEGRMLAAIVGVFLLEPAIAALLLPQVTDQPVNKMAVAIHLYLAASHFLWAAGSKPLWPKRASEL